MLKNGYTDLCGRSLCVPSMDIVYFDILWFLVVKCLHGLLVCWDKAGYQAAKDIYTEELSKFIRYNVDGDNSIIYRMRGE